MISILDNISAVIVGGGLLLILGATVIHSQQTAVEQTAFYASKKHTLEFANTVADELRLIGAGLLETQRVEMISSPRTIVSPFTPPSGTDSDGDSGDDGIGAFSVTDTLSFWRPGNSAGVALRVDYVLVTADSVSTSGMVVPLFRVDRYENGELAGSSPSTLTSFRVQLLDGNGNDVGMSLEAARLVRVSFVNALPFNDRGNAYLRQTHWGLTVRPQNLNL